MKKRFGCERGGFFSRDALLAGNGLSSTSRRTCDHRVLRSLRCDRSLDRLLSQAVRQGKDVLRLEQEREKLASELSEAQNMYMQSLEDIKVRQTRAFADSLQDVARGNRG